MTSPTDPREHRLVAAKDHVVDAAGTVAGKAKSAVHRGQS